MDHAEVGPSGYRRKGASKGKKSHRCEVAGCLKTFSRKEHLRRHQLNHQSENSFLCVLCGSTFVRQDLWRRHWRIKHYREPPTSDPSHVQISKHEKKQPHIQEDTATLLQASDNKDTPPSIQLEQVLPSSRPLDQHTESHSWPEYTTHDDFSFFQTDHSRSFGNIVGHGTQEALTHDENVFMSSGFDYRYSSFTSATELAWLFDESHTLQQRHSDPAFADGIEKQCHRGDTPNDSCASADPNGASTGRTGNQNSQFFEDNSDVQDLPSPTCGFRVCNAVTEEHRLELLSSLLFTESEMQSPVLSLNSIRQGIHLYSRSLSKEYPILHAEILAPSTNDKEYIDNYYGEEAPAGLLWAVITFGWLLLDGVYTAHRLMARKIQSQLRKIIISHPALTLSPPLWVIQTLFLTLAFARYHGSEEESGFATIFHGVLIDSVHRLDLKSSQKAVLRLHDRDSLHREWIKWIRSQTLTRVVFHTFILDVQQALLHGGDITLSPFELNLRLPESDDAWFAPSLDQWVATHENQVTEPPHFLTMLKSFYNSSTIKPTPLGFPRGSKAIMYGILSIAYDMRRRDENTFSQKVLYSPSSLGLRVQRSFEKWLQWWDETYSRKELESVHLWRNCSCVFRLGHTLYEIGTMEWQVFAGTEFILGRRIDPAEYLKAKRKIKAWVKQERALVGVSYAAKIIQERLSPSYQAQTHCEHCRWCLYLAGLVCWGFGFATSGIDAHQTLIEAGMVSSFEEAEQSAMKYLAAVSKAPEKHDLADVANQTTGVLVILIDILDVEANNSGQIENGIRLLKRLTGLSK